MNEATGATHRARAAGLLAIRALHIVLDFIIVADMLAGLTEEACLDVYAIFGICDGRSSWQIRMRLSLSMLFRPLASCLNPCKGSIFRVQRACVSNLRKTTDHTPDMLKSQGAVRGLKPLAALQSPPQRNVPAASVSARQLSLKVKLLGIYLKGFVAEDSV